MADRIAALAIGPSVPLELVNGEPPTEIRLFRAGTNPSAKGDWIFDDRAAGWVMATYREMGRAWVNIDYDHGSLQKNPVDPSKSSKSAGIAKLELRDGDLWATDIRLSKPARQSIIDGEWPSVSPGFAYDEDRRITWLINFALTGNPALHNPYELVAANVVAERLAELSAVPYRGHEVASGSWDADGAVARLRRWASSDDSGDADTIDWDKYASGFAWVDPEKRESFGGYKLPHHDVQGGALVDVRSGVQAAASAIQGARGGVDIPAADVAAVRSHLGRHYKQWGGVAPWDQKERANTMKDLKGLMKKKSIPDLAAFFGVEEEEMREMMAEQLTVAKPDATLMSAALSVGLEATATAPQLIERMSSVAKFERDILTALSAKEHQAALGAIEGLLATEKKAKADADALAKIEKEQLESKAVAMLSTARDEKRITKAEFDDTSDHGYRASAIARGLQWLEHNLKHRTPIATLTIDHKEPAKSGAAITRAVTLADGRRYEQLSFPERAALENDDPETCAAMRADWAKRGKPIANQSRDTNAA